MQKGEITLTDLAQSESSLAGAKSKYIAAETELLTTKSNVERIIRIKDPNKIIENFNIEINLPNSLAESLSLSEKNNPKLLIARLNYQISEKNLNIQKAKLSPTASINFSKSEYFEDFDDFIRFENLQHDLKRIFNKLNLETQNFDIKINQTDRKDYKYYYDSRTIEKV